MAKITLYRSVTDIQDIEAGTTKRTGEASETVLNAWETFQYSLKEAGILIQDFKIELIGSTLPNTNESIGVIRGDFHEGQLDKAFEETITPNWEIFLETINSNDYYFEKGDFNIKIVDNLL